MPLQLAIFEADITTPLGHPLMFGGAPPATHIVDAQLAKGIILKWNDAPPIVLVALDWCEIRNEGYDQWRDAIAQAVSTSRDRVMLQCVHQHAAMYGDPEAEKRLRASGCPTSSMDLAFFDGCCIAVANAARAAAAGNWTEVSNVGHGRTKVEHVASNRRMKGPDGQLLPMRTSSCTDAELRDEPEGLIDPILKTVSFWSDKKLLAALHYYATHPMSYYRDGGVSKDFCGLARELVQQDTDAFHVYFTGCAGNIAAGKYNDGSPEMRPVLRDRIAAGMRTSLESSTREFVRTFTFHAIPVRLPTREEYTDEWYINLLNDAAGSHNTRYRGAAGLTWRNRLGDGAAIDFTCLAMNDIRLLQLPGEPFVEYQLYTQQQRPELFVCVAGYGDCGPGYIPVASAYPDGGYEVGPPALVGPGAECVIRETIDKLLHSAG
ncbi:MAG: hypothetical protein ACR2IE_18680 [Candidatus Sumerlaeaceae bacterium]